MSGIKRALEDLEAAADTMGLDEAPTWLLNAPDADDNKVRENLIHRAADAGLTASSEISLQDAADYTGIDVPTLKLLIKRGVLEQNGGEGTDVVYDDLITLMRERHFAKANVQG